MVIHLQRVPMLPDLRLQRLSSNTSCEELKLLDNITLPSLAKVLLVGGSGARSWAWRHCHSPLVLCKGSHVLGTQALALYSKAIGWVPKWLLCRARSIPIPTFQVKSPQVWEETTQSLETRKKMTVKLFGPAAGVSCHIVMIPSSRWPLKSAFFSNSTDLMKITSYLINKNVM